MRRRAAPTLVAFVGITVLALVGVLVAGWKPLLGLDLQGGVSVVLKPKQATDSQKLNQAIAIIRNRVDALGVAEPDISRQGSNIVVSLPGVKDQQRALDLVGTTAELRFRPVLQMALPPGSAQAGTSTTAPGSPTTTAAPTDTSAAVGGGSSSTVAPGGSSSTTAAPASSTSEAGLGAGSGPIGTGEVALGGGPSSDLAQDGTTTTTAPTATTAAPATTAAGGDATTTTTAAGGTTATTTAPGAVPSIDQLTPRDQDLAPNVVVLPQYDPKHPDTEQFRYLLGPTLASGQGVSDAQMVLNPQTGEPYVQLTFKDGANGIDAWRAAAKECFSGTPVCPTKQLAIVLDGRVLSAPTVNDTFSNTKNAQITGSFSRSEAQNLATALRYGALPVELERQQAQEVSASVGKDALHAGLVAGILGLVLVALYILFYYKLFGAVAIASLALSFGLLWSIIAWLGNSRGLALTLSGVVGIIVSIGISVDSNIVYFEVIKDEMHHGRTLRVAANHAFHSAMRTIIRADAVSLIAAALLYWLTVGSVRGFAFYLGLATILDLVASYFFMRPAVHLLADTRWAREHPSWFGIPKPKPVPAEPAAATKVPV